MPLAVAAVREVDSPAVEKNVRAAITQSDNAAAEELWAALGAPLTAASKVQSVLDEAGDAPTVESQHVRPGFTAFGQTRWTLTAQARYGAFLACDTVGDEVYGLMGEIASGQRWGLGTLPDSRYKGGWGPDESGNYLVRQFGVVATSRGRVAVVTALAEIPH